MTRDVTPAYAAELDAPLVRPVIFYEGEFSGDTLRLWSGVGPKDWNGQTWTGAGNLVSISDVTETAETTAQGITTTLSGMPSDLISLVHTEAQQGLPGRVWLAFLDASDAIIADPFLAFSGRLDVPAVEDRGDTCSISIQYESRLVDLQRPRVWRYTHESQQAVYPDDLGFEYVAELQQKEILW
jgi:hypothetical protein